LPAFLAFRFCKFGASYDSPFDCRPRGFSFYLARHFSLVTGFTMLTTLRTIWLRLTASRYTRALESENARLREENRALLNSILGIAGIPPLRFDAGLARKHRQELHATPSAEKPVASHNAPPQGHPRDRATRTNGLIVPPGPLRRRSWQQIGRMLEIEDARRLNNRDNSDSMS
jgi:hypothetical protein